MQLNLRHKIGIFLTAILVGGALLTEVSMKESLGVALICLAVTWLIGMIPVKGRKRIDVEAQSPNTAGPSERSGPAEAGNPEVVAQPLPPKPRDGGGWIWLCISTVIFVLLLALAIFNVTWQAIGGDPEKSGESLGHSLLFLIAFALATRAAYKNMLARQPLSDMRTSTKIRRYNLIGGVGACTVLAFAASAGVTVGQRTERNRRLDGTLAELKKQAPRTTQLRAQMKEIVSEDTPTYEDYYRRNIRLEKVLDDYEVHQKIVRPLLDSVRDQATDQPKIQEMVIAVERINDKDAEVVRIFREIIARTKELVELPANQRDNYYRQRIVPLAETADRTANEELQMMRDAEKQGVKWPKDVEETLKH